MDLGLQVLTGCVCYLLGVGLTYWVYTLLTWWAWGCAPGGTGTYWVCVLLTGCVCYLLGGRGAVHLGVQVLTGCVCYLLGVCVTYWVCVLLTGWAWGCAPGGTGTYWVCVLLTYWVYTLLTGCVCYLLGVCVTYWVWVLLTGSGCYLLGGRGAVHLGVQVVVGLWYLEVEVPELCPEGLRQGAVTEGRAVGRHTRPLIEVGDFLPKKQENILFSRH